MATNIYMDTYEGVPNAFNLGMTQGRYEDRHKNSDYGKQNQALAVFDSERQQFGWWVDTDLVDHTIHDWLKKQPYLTAIGRETFKFPKNCGLTLDIVKHMIHQEFFTVTPKKEDLNLEKHQQEFVNKILSSWEEWREFLLFAKCRAGKSIMVLSAIASKGVKVSLIVSRYTSPIQSWKEDSKNFSEFNDLVFINLADKNYLKEIEYWYNTDKQLVLWTTIQGGNRWNKIPCDVDLIVYDEAHQGYNSTQFKKLHKKFDCQVLYVTGTAFDMIWDFSESNSYTYSYFEEQLNKKQGLNNAPSMRVILAKYDTDSYQKLYGDDPDAMKNLFSINEDKTDFMEPSLVQDFYATYFGDQKFLKPKDRLLNGKFHIYMALPSVAACYASVKYLEKTKFSPLVVTGDAKKDPDSIRKHVAENDYSIILTVSANVLGVTVREIDTVINATEGESLNFWTQFAFRGGSSNHDWDVIDFCPQRCLNSLREAFIAACDNAPQISEFNMLDFVSITEWSSGFESISQDQIASILASDVSNTISMVSGTIHGMDYEKLSHCQFNLNLFSMEKQKVDKHEVNENGANGKGNLKREGEASEKQDNSELLAKKETIRSILKRVPLTVYHCIKSDSVPNSIDNVINSEHYIHNTLDSEGIIAELVREGVIDAKSFSYRINQAVVDIQHSMKEDECKTLEKLSCSRQNQMSMPLELVKSLLDISL